MPDIWTRVVQILSGSKTPPYRVIELKEGMSEGEGDEAAIASLASHPGFKALMYRKRLKRAALETTLKSARHKEIREVDFLQSGIYWLRFDESEVNTAIGNLRGKAVPRTASAIEEEEFNRVRSAIESIGITNPS